MGSWTLPAPRARKETVVRNQEAQELCQGIPGLWNTKVSAAPSPHPHLARPPLTARARQARFPLGSQAQLSPHSLGFTSLSIFLSSQQFSGSFSCLIPQRPYEGSKECFHFIDREVETQRGGSKDLAKVILPARGPVRTQTQAFRYQIQHSFGYTTEGLFPVIAVLTVASPLSEHVSVDA